MKMVMTPEELVHLYADTYKRITAEFAVYYP